MSKASPAFTSFNSGEFSPMLSARMDHERYKNGCEALQNMIPTVQGPALRRGGTRHIASTKEISGRQEKVYLHPFVFNETTAYVLEFGSQYIRFYTNNAQLQISGVPVEVVSPYSLNDIFASNGTCRLRFAQSGDFLYITHPSYQPRILKRVTATSFVLDLFEPKGGPFIGVDPDTTTTVWSSGETGSVTLTASASIFQAGHVGTLFLIERKNVSGVIAWEPGKAVNSGDLRRSDSKIYSALNSTHTGVVKPVHSFGAESDGAVNWEFMHAGYGWARITSVTSGTVASATVISRIPSDAVGSGNATTRWSFSDWSSVEGWPSSVAFFRERLCFARGQNIWMSVAAAFDDFSARNDSGEITDDMAISLEVASGELNAIQWLHADRMLVAGTAGGEFSIGELTNGDPLGPGNVKAEIVSGYGSRGVQPVRSGDRSLFVMPSGRKVREIGFDFSQDGYQSKDVTVLSDHITDSGIVDMDFAIEPYSVVWCVRADGVLLGFTWNNEEQVQGWHRHLLGGSSGVNSTDVPWGVVESVAVIPRPNGRGDQVWMSVRRGRPDGWPVAPTREVVYMEDPFIEENNGYPVPIPTARDQFYVDSGSTHTPGGTVVSGLSRLNGQTVAVLADGAPHPDCVVSGGSITLQRSAQLVQVGLRYSSILKPMRIEAGAADGTAQGKTKRIHKVVFRLVSSSSFRYGSRPDNLLTMEFRTAANQMDRAVPLYTGDRLVDWPGGYETDGYIYIESDSPTALGIAGIFPQIVTQDSR